MLPAQNATGNWVKVIQRLAVRIKIDHVADEPPLRAGMSVTADIDVGFYPHLAPGITQRRSNPMATPPIPHFTPVKNKALITVSIMLATIMQALDTTIANVALPHMQGALAATQEQISWVLTSYIIAAAIMTSPTGSSRRRSGARISS